MPQNIASFRHRPQNTSFSLCIPFRLCSVVPLLGTFSFEEPFLRREGRSINNFNYCISRLPISSASWFGQPLRRRDDDVACRRQIIREGQINSFDQTVVNYLVYRIGVYSVTGADTLVTLPGRYYHLRSVHRTWWDLFIGIWVLTMSVSFAGFASVYVSHIRWRCSISGIGKYPPSS